MCRDAEDGDTRFMPNQIGDRERDHLWKLIQYLNLDEMREFCSAHGLPMHICVEREDGRLHKTSDRDRKDVILRRIVDLAVTGEISGPTVYAKDVVSDDPLPEDLSARTRVRYGQYDKKNADFLRLMKSLTGGAYRHGMIARLVLRDFWTSGKAPTMKQFAEAWLQATAEHTEPRPEGAYLVDLSRGTAGLDWKALRIRNAKEALALLEDCLV